MVGNVCYATTLNLGLVSVSWGSLMNPQFWRPRRWKLVLSNV